MDGEMNIETLVAEIVRVGVSEASKKFGITPATATLLSTGLALAFNEIKRSATRGDPNEANA